jgi:hypothetical protein
MDERTFSSDMIATGVEANERLSERWWRRWEEGDFVVEEVRIRPLSRGGEVHFGVEIGARRLTDALRPLGGRN